MWDEMLGENVPCPLCRDEICNGSCRVSKKRPVVDVVRDTETAVPKKPLVVKGNAALMKFFTPEEVFPVGDPDFEKAFRERMKELGRKGGKAGGKKTAERGPDYYKEIRKRRKTYVRKK